MPSCHQDYLTSINRLIEDRLKPLASDTLFGTSENLLNEACAHLCLSPHAKRVRPLLCLYYHELFCEQFESDFINIGVAAEFIHAASLLHDDIIDEADKRRGVITANHRYGNKTAVLGGDYLLTEAFNLLLPFDRILIERAISVVREMTKSAIAELNARGNTDLTPLDVQKIALGKTGLLFSWCGFAVSVLCKKPQATDNLWQLGKHIGMLFQLADDIKDFDGDKQLKDVCRDIRNLDPSMPIVLALAENPLIKQRFTTLLANGEIAEADALDLREMIIATKALEKTRSMMGEHVTEAMKLLNDYQISKGKEYVENFISALCLS